MPGGPPGGMGRGRGRHAHRAPRRGSRPWRIAPAAARRVRIRWPATGTGPRRLACSGEARSNTQQRRPGHRRPGQGNATAEG